MTFDHDDAYRLAQDLRAVSYRIPVGPAVDLQALARQVDDIADAILDVVKGERHGQA